MGFLFQQCLFAFKGLYVFYLFFSRPFHLDLIGFNLTDLDLFLFRSPQLGLLYFGDLNWVVVFGSSQLGFVLL